MGLNRYLTLAIIFLMGATLTYLHQAIQGYAFVVSEIFDAALHHEKIIIGFLSVGIVILLFNFRKRR
jgi:hypothetical protein